ncbi:MAG: hypothetical protein KA758_02710 [Acidimicrobiales bacterium]|nr:hypothetical protein [Acidimicrobiales bacterium]
MTDTETSTHYDVYEAAAQLASDADRVSSEVWLLRDHIDTLVNILTRVEARLRDSEQRVFHREEHIDALLKTIVELENTIAELEGKATP